MSPPSSRWAPSVRSASAVTGAGDLRLLLSPEVAIFAVFALVGEFVPLKVFTRGAEGEVTTSTCFALATMLAAGPLAAFICLASANLLADGIRRKPVKKIAFNILQYAITIAAAGAVLRGHDRSPARARAAHRPGRPDRRPARRDRLLRLQHGDRRDGDRDGPAPRGLHLPRARPAVSDLDRRADARARPGRRPHRRLRAAGDPAALPADLRRPPRWPRGDREGAPGAARRADRPAQPRALPRPDRPGRPLGPPQRRTPPWS